jgi:hypothetical protein
MATGLLRPPRSLATRIDAVSTALADPPAAPTEQQPSAGSPGPEHAAASAQRSTTRPCAECGAPLVDGQDWCLQCGTGAPDSLRTRTPTWRSAAVVLTTLAVLVAGAAGAAYAALSKDTRKPSSAATTIAQAPAPASVAPPATSTTPLPPAVTGSATTPKIGIPTTIKPSTAPKIPLSVPTPKPTVTPVPKITPSTGLGGGTPTSKQNAPVGEANAEALLLDTNAASTYNPYNYAASNFGDPSLAIDGDTTTGWTALIEPSVAPKMAEGLVIDLNTPRKLAAVGLATSTPGMTVQVYGADGAAPPSSITDPAWAALTPALQAKKKHARIKLGGSGGAVRQAATQAHRFIVLWISKAPASAVGTPAAPGHVAIDELELFPLKKK